MSSSRLTGDFTSRPTTRSTKCDFQHGFAHAFEAPSSVIDWSNCSVDCLGFAEFLAP